MGLGFSQQQNSSHRITLTILLHLGYFLLGVHFRAVPASLHGVSLWMPCHRGVGRSATFALTPREQQAWAEFEYAMELLCMCTIWTNFFFPPSNDKNISVRSGSNHFNIICVKNIGFHFPSTTLKALNRQITRVE